MSHWTWRGWWTPLARDRPERLRDAFRGNARAATTAAAPARSPIGRPGSPSPKRSSSAAAPRIQIHCFGGFVVECAGRPLHSRGWALPWQLLAYLAVHPADGVPRADLVSAIWGDAVPIDSSRVNVALGRLRVLLHDQVPGLCSTVVTSHRDGTVCLDTATIQSDVHEAWHVVATATRCTPAERRAAVARMRPRTATPLLEGCRWPWVQQRDGDGPTLGERLAIRLDTLAQLGDDETVERRQNRRAPRRAGRRQPARWTPAPPFPC